MSQNHKARTNEGERRNWLLICNTLINTADIAFIAPYLSVPKDRSFLLVNNVEVPLREGLQILEISYKDKRTLKMPDFDRCIMKYIMSGESKPFSFATTDPFYGAIHDLAWCSLIARGQNMLDSYVNHFLKEEEGS